MESDPALERMRAERNRLLGWHLPRTVADYPLETVASVYGVFAAVATLIPWVDPPSSILGQMPRAIEILWGGSLLVAAVTMLYGLDRGRVRLAVLSRGVMLFGFVIIAFGFGLLAINGWGRLLSATFLLGAGVVSLLRSLRLRVDYYVTLEVLTIEHRRNGDSGHAEEG
jgi:hypothetical protein